MINTDGKTLEEALIYRIHELTHCYYAATGAPTLAVRLEYAEYMRNEAEAIAFASAQLIGNLKREIAAAALKTE